MISNSLCCPHSTISNIVKHGGINSVLKYKKTTKIRSYSNKKQLERATRIANLPPAYHGQTSSQDRNILVKPVEILVENVKNGLFKPIDILRAYGKVAIRAHEKTNCLTEVMLSAAEQWTETGINLNGPLAGIPVSLKDTFAVGGFDITVGYSFNVGKPCLQDGPLTRILKDAG